MRLCVLDGYTLNPGDNSWDDLASLGELVVYERTPPDLVRQRAADAEIVITNKTILDATTLNSLPGLRLVAVLATGFNVVDVMAARARGVPVVNVPEYGSASVAQHVFALILELAQHVGSLNRAVAAGEWTRSADFCFWERTPIELDGLTMGIVGVGRIGRRVAQIAAGFGMHTVGHRGSGEVGAVPIEMVGFETLVRTSDVVSLHCPLTDTNEKLINASVLGAMKRSAFLVNTARGGLVDEAALAAALQAGTIAGAGLDVVTVEPIRPDSPLLGIPNCVITPHVAWATLAARRRLMQATVGNIRAFLAGAPRNVVNP